MIPAALIGIYAINRLGAVHAIVFGGFASNALAQRIDASRPVAILTSSCGIDGTKAPMSYQPLVEEAVKLSTHKPSKILVWQREQLPWSPISQASGERDWAALVGSAKKRGVKADCVPVKSTDPIYIIHTSGTTGSPKGVLREAGGHAVGLHLSISYLFDVHGPGCVMFTASDIGWVVGHSVSQEPPLSDPLPYQLARGLTPRSTSSTPRSSPAPQRSSTRANPSAPQTPRPSGASWKSTA